MEPVTETLYGHPIQWEVLAGLRPTSSTCTLFRDHERTTPFPSDVSGDVTWSTSFFKGATKTVVAYPPSSYHESSYHDVWPTMLTRTPGEGDTTIWIRVDGTKDTVVSTLRKAVAAGTARPKFHLK